MTSFKTSLVFIASMFSLGFTFQDSEQLAAIRLASESNRTATTKGLIKYALSIGESDAIESIKAGKWNKVSIASCSYLFDQENGLFSKEFTRDDLLARRTKLGNEQYVSPISSIRIVTNGTLSVVDKPDVKENFGEIFHFAQIYPSNEQYVKQVIIPLNIGLNKPGYFDIESLFALTDKLSSDLFVEARSLPKAEDKNKILSRTAKELQHHGSRR